LFWNFAELAASGQRIQLVAERGLCPKPGFRHRLANTLSRPQAMQMSAVAGKSERFRERDADQD